MTVIAQVLDPLRKPMGNYKDISGQRFGRLVALKPYGVTRDNHIAWECVCDCQTVTIVSSASLRKGKKGTRSCGCLRSETSQHTHRGGWNKGQTYAVWDGVSRAYKTKHGWAKAVRRSQGNVCIVCGWDKARCDVHHIISQSQGGLNTLDNGQVLCPNCHRILHERGECQ